MLAKDAERVVFIGDVHVPYHDTKAVAAALAFVRWFKPHHCYLIGDILDCYQLSRFDKNPDELRLSDELEAGRKLLAEVGKALTKDCVRHYLEGNHEHRLTRWLWSTEGRKWFGELSLPRLLNLDELGYKHYPYAGPISHRGFLVEHGDKSSRWSAYTAKAMLDSRGKSGISGHTHRMGAYYRRDTGGIMAWFENGCLCRLNPDYIHGSPNWQHGFSVGYYVGKRFHVEQVPVIEGKVFYQGRLFNA